MLTDNFQTPNHNQHHNQYHILKNVQHYINLSLNFVEQLPYKVQKPFADRYQYQFRLHNSRQDYTELVDIENQQLFDNIQKLFVHQLDQPFLVHKTALN